MLHDPAGAPAGFLDALLDLALGSSCVGCERPGRMLCADCARALPARPRPAWPSPAPPGLAPPWAAAEYGGVVRSLVVGHKEESRHGLGRPLGRLLAAAVDAAVPAHACAAGEVLLLVGVPSRPGVARRRGDDPTGRIVGVAAAALAASGRTVRVAGLLRSRRGVADQAGLDAAHRADNLRGSMYVPAPPLRRLAAPGRRAHVVVCDDVLTTGSTAREAQRALEAVGVAVAAIAVVAAVPRRRPPPPSSAGTGPGRPAPGV